MVWGKNRYERAHKLKDKFEGLSKISGNDAAVALFEARHFIANLYDQKGKYKIYHQDLNKLRTYYIKDT